MRLRRHVRPNAFGNALGQGIADAGRPSDPLGDFIAKNEARRAGQDGAATSYNSSVLSNAMAAGEDLAPTMQNLRRLGMFNIDADGQLASTDRAALSFLSEAGLSQSTAMQLAPKMAFVADMSGGDVNDAWTFGLNAAQRTRMSAFDTTARERWQNFPTQLEAFDNAYAQTQNAGGAAQVATLSAMRQYVVDAMPAQVNALTSSSPAEAARLDKLHSAMVNGLLSYDVYYDTSIPQLMPTGYSRLSAAEMPRGFNAALLEDSRSGYFSGLYRNASSGAYVLADRGTEGPDRLDIRANVMQAFGLENGQYTSAMAAAQMLQRVVGNNLSFTGHSLGGGLASAQAIATGLPATTFNAAGLNLLTMQRFDSAAYTSNWNRADSLISAYYVNGDPLSRNQDSLVLQQGTAARGAEISRLMSRDPTLGLSAFGWGDRGLLLPMRDGSFTSTEPNVLPRAIGTRYMLQPTPEPVFNGSAVTSGFQVPSGMGLHGMGNVMFGLFGQLSPR